MIPMHIKERREDGRKRLEEGHARLRGGDEIARLESLHKRMGDIHAEMDRSRHPTVVGESNPHRDAFEAQRSIARTAHEEMGKHLAELRKEGAAENEDQEPEDVEAAA